MFHLISEDGISKLKIIFVNRKTSLDLSTLDVRQCLELEQIQLDCDAVSSLQVIVTTTRRGRQFFLTSYPVLHTIQQARWWLLRAFWPQLSLLFITALSVDIVVKKAQLHQSTFKVMNRYIVTTVTAHSAKYSLQTGFESMSSTVFLWTLFVTSART